MFWIIGGNCDKVEERGQDHFCYCSGIVERAICFPTTILWGYDHQYPEAEIVGANLATAMTKAYANANDSCIMPVYATLEVDFQFPVFNGNCVEQYSNVLVYFYKDAARTIPYSVNYMIIQIK